MHRVVVQLRRRDALFAQLQVILRMRTWIVLFVVCLATTWYQWIDSDPRPDLATGIPAMLLTAIFFSVVAVAITFLIFLPVVLLRLRKAPGTLGKHTIEVDEGGLRSLSEAREILVARGNARKALRTWSYFLVSLPGRGTILVPRREFADAAADRDFWNALQPLVAK